jgi:hypothetical protein
VISRTRDRKGTLHQIGQFARSSDASVLEIASSPDHPMQASTIC